MRDEMKKDTFGLKIFGRDPPSKRMTEKSLKLSKKRQEKEETKKKLEEEKKRQEEEETRLEEEVESDHHGRIYVDYRVPRPSNFPQQYKFTKEVKCGVGTFAEVFMCTL